MECNIIMMDSERIYPCYDGFKSFAQNNAPSSSDVFDLLDAYQCFINPRYIGGKAIIDDRECTVVIDTNFGNNIVVSFDIERLGDRATRLAKDICIELNKKIILEYIGSEEDE